MRVAVVQTHPVQYLAPWFQYIARERPEIDLQVIYATRPTPQQQGAGFGTAFEWDVPLTSGYANLVLRPPRPQDDLLGGPLRGVDGAGVGDALRQADPDVVLVPGWNAPVFLRALLWCRRRGIPALYRGDTNLGNRPSGPAGLAWDLRTRLLLHLFSGHLATGSRSRQYLERFGCRHVFASPHCVDNAAFAEAAALRADPEARARIRAELGLRADAFVALFVGKLEAKKRPLDLLAAASRLGGAVQVAMVGTGELEASCRAAASESGLPVVWLGFRNQSQLLQVYAAADCLVLPSDAGETWGLVVNEAMAAGLPCAVSRAAGCAPDMVTPGVTGELFALGDVAELAAALGRLRSAAPGSRSAACQARAASHSFARATDGLLAAGRALAPIRVLACCTGMVMVSGLERMTFEVLRVLRDDGAAVHCVVNTWENERIVALAEAQGATWSTVRYLEALDRRARDPRRWVRIGWDLLLANLGLLREAWRFRPTHVLLPEFVSVLRHAPALLALRCCGIPALLRLGNAPGRRDFDVALWRHALARVVTICVANSHFTRERLAAVGVPARKAVTIRNCIPRRPARADRLERAHGPRRTLLCVGQIAPFKGTHLAVDAALELIREGHDVELLVVGREPEWPPDYVAYVQAIKDRIRAARSESRVAFVGEREDVLDLMREAYLLIAPIPEEEGFGLVVLEAKSAGLPAVVFPSGGLAEQVRHQVDGWLCAEPTPGALLEGLRHYLGSPQAREQASAAGRAWLAEPRCDLRREAFARRWRDLVRSPRRLLAEPVGPVEAASRAWRVLEICTGMVVVSGVERMAFETLRGLRESGAAVHCLISSWHGERIAALAEAIGATWSEGRYREALVRSVRDPRRLARIGWDLWLANLDLMRAARAFRPSHVLVPDHVSVLRHVPALLLLRLRGIPVVLHLGNAPERPAFYERLWRYAVARTVSTCVANSYFTRDRLLSIGVPRRKVATIRNCVPRRPGAAREASAVSSGRRELLCVGQIAPFKGTHLAVDALLQLLREGRDVGLSVVGREPDWPASYVTYSSEIRQRAAPAGDRVRFLGEREDVLDLMRRAYLLLTPIPEEEGFGLVVLEAKSVGLPAVVFPMGGLVEQVRHRVDGWLCREASLEALLEGIRHYLDAPAERDRAAAAGRDALDDSACDLRPEAFAARWRALLHSLDRTDGRAR